MAEKSLLCWKIHIFLDRLERYIDCTRTSPKKTCVYACVHVYVYMESIWDGVYPLKLTPLHFDHEDFYLRFIPSYSRAPLPSSVFLAPPTYITLLSFSLIYFIPKPKSARFSLLNLTFTNVIVLFMCHGSLTNQNISIEKKNNQKINTISRKKPSRHHHLFAFFRWILCTNFRLISSNIWDERFVNQYLFVRDQNTSEYKNRL